MLVDKIINQVFLLFGKRLVSYKYICTSQFDSFNDFYDFYDKWVKSTIFFEFAEFGCKIMSIFLKE